MIPNGIIATKSGIGALQRIKEIRNSSRSPRSLIPGAGDTQRAINMLHWKQQKNIGIFMNTFWELETKSKASECTLKTTVPLLQRTQCGLLARGSRRGISPGSSPQSINELGFGNTCRSPLSIDFASKATMQIPLRSSSFDGTE